MQFHSGVITLTLQKKEYSQSRFIIAISKAVSIVVERRPKISVPPFRNQYQRLDAEPS